VTALRLLLAALAGVACAALIACGGKTDHLIPTKNASSLEQQLSAVQSSVDQGDCVTAGSDLGNLTKAVDNLPSSVDAQLRERLTRGVAHLVDIAPDACAAKQTVTETTPAVTTDTTATETQPEPEPTPTETTETPTTTEAPPETDTGENRQDQLPQGPSDDTGGVTAP
jgi:hypothetical protein